MIYITGDTHGLIDFQKIKDYFKHRFASENDVLIILGDAGIVWSEKDCYITQYGLLRPTVLFIDGNHENFPLLNQFPVVERFGAKVHYLGRSVYHVLRGEILHINGLSFLCLGGATSIDKAHRTPGLTWWPEEHIAEEDVQRALDNLIMEGGKVDYVLTHCAPTRIVREMFGYSWDNDTDKLEYIRSECSFIYWFFGHYHEDKTHENFRCFYNDILEIPAMKTGKRPIKQHLLTLEDDAASPYLRHWKTGRKTRLTVADLPEWFLSNYSYRYWFYDMSGVKDVAYEGSPFDNHISKDSRIYLSYDDTHPKNKDQSPKNEKDWEVHTWRTSLVDVILALEKYSPGLKLERIKAQINLTYDQYNNGDMYDDGSDVVCRPFPEVKTPRYHARWGGGIAHYAVYHGDRILGTFIEKERAIEYADFYVTRNLRLKRFRYEERKEDPYYRAYDTGHDLTQRVRIKPIGEKGE